jgi:hypothetical protein
MHAQTCTKAFGERTMSNQQQHKQWADHLEDEAAELVRQQSRAGADHAPTVGPLPHSKDDLREAVAAAVAAERERCAHAARAWTRQDKLWEVFGDVGAPQLEAAARVAQAIAADIAAGG